MRYARGTAAVLFVLTTAIAGAAPASPGDTFPVVAIRPGVPPSYSLMTLAGVGPCSRRQGPLRKAPLGASSFDALAAAPGIRRIVFFVPGYATGVPLALQAARRIRAAFEPADLLVVVDWGSRGKKSRYEQDARSARSAAPALAQFLSDVHRTHRDTEIDVFAHSMGTRVVAKAMSVVTVPANSGHVVERAVLAAPDMTLADYQRAIARNPVPVGHVTVYASRFDKALLVSTMIHLHQRLGRLRSWRKPLARTDVVDASVASHGMDGHGYALKDPVLLRDIGATLAGAPVPHADWRRAKPDAVSWTYAPAAPAPPAPSCAPQARGR